MKGKLILTPVKEPKEGIKVVVKGIEIGVVVNKFQGAHDIFESMWNVRTPIDTYVYFPSELQQIAIEYKQTQRRAEIGLGLRGHGSEIFKEEIVKTLPIHPEDYEKALPLIGQQEVEFDQKWVTDGISRPVVDGGIPKDYKGTWYAKLITPAPIVYTEEEVAQKLRLYYDYLMECVQVVDFHPVLG